MSAANNQEEFYNKLRVQLEDTSLWPSEYLYKFIVPAKSNQVKIIDEIFNDMGAVITTRKSKKGTYISTSVNVRMKNPDAVIEKYKEVTKKVEGVISL